MTVINIAITIADGSYKHSVIIAITDDCYKHSYK